jgi:ABC transport system ATP-binding/permease protein
VDTIFAFQADRTLRQYPGNYSIYLDFKKSEEDAAAAAEKAIATPSAAPQPKVSEPEVTPAKSSRKMSYKEKRELEELEAKIPKMEAQKVALEKTLYGNVPSGFTDVKKLSEELAALEKAIEVSTERWMELSELAS